MIKERVGIKVQYANVPMVERQKIAVNRYAGSWEREFVETFVMGDQGSEKLLRSINLAVEMVPEIPPIQRDIVRGGVQFLRIIVNAKKSIGQRIESEKNGDQYRTTPQVLYEIHRNGKRIESGFVEEIDEVEENWIENCGDCVRRRNANAIRIQVRDYILSSPLLHGRVISQEIDDVRVVEEVLGAMRLFDQCCLFGRPDDVCAFKLAKEAGMPRRAMLIDAIRSVRGNLKSSSRYLALGECRSCKKKIKRPQRKSTRLAWFKDDWAGYLRWFSTIEEHRRLKLVEWLMGFNQFAAEVGRAPLPGVDVLNSFIVNVRQQTRQPKIEEWKDRIESIVLRNEHYWRMIQYELADAKEIEDVTKGSGSGQGETMM